MTKQQRRSKTAAVVAAKKALFEKGRRWLVVGDVAAHTARMVPFHMNDMYDYFYQDMKGSHGTVLGEFKSELEAQECLREFLKCDAAEMGTYCHSHNPQGR